MNSNSSVSKEPKKTESSSHKKSKSVKSKGSEKQSKNTKPTPSISSSKKQTIKSSKIPSSQNGSHDKSKKSADGNNNLAGASKQSSVMGNKLEKLSEPKQQIVKQDTSAPALLKGEKSLPTSSAVFNRSKVSPAIRKQVKSLPITSKREEFLQMVKENQMVIVVGGTGSGKSTQIPQFLADAGFTSKGKIGITQPRRVAAISLAERVSEECGVKLGTHVGYSVRFDKLFSKETIIKYMTDGVLVEECIFNRDFNSYSVIIIDEAHERSIESDICFGLLKRAARRRPDLK